MEYLLWLEWNSSEIYLSFQDEVKELYKFRDFFFENHPMEMATQKVKLVTEKLAAMSGKLDLLDGNNLYKITL